MVERLLEDLLKSAESPGWTQGLADVHDLLFMVVLCVFLAVLLAQEP